jgi:hypothetical protein
MAHRTHRRLARRLDSKCWLIRASVAHNTQISPLYPTLEQGFAALVSAVCGIDPLSNPDSVELVRRSRRQPHRLVRYYCTDAGKIVQVP